MAGAQIILRVDSRGELRPSKDEEEGETAQQMQWSMDMTQKLIKLRVQYDSSFTKKRNSARASWEKVIKEMGKEGQVTPHQASKKWENLKNKYKIIQYRKLHSGEGDVTTVHWPHFNAMHAALGGRPSVDPPVLISSTDEGPEDELAPIDDEAAFSCEPSDPTPSTSQGLATQADVPVRKKSKLDQVLEMIREDSAQEERRHQQRMAQNEKFLALFEALVKKRNK